jgi:chromosome segregation ATPase
MADSEVPINTMRQRLSDQLAEWDSDFSALLTELEEKRARLEELEADAADNSSEVDVLSKRVEAQDTLIESLNVDADEAAALRKELYERELELETKAAEIDSKQVLIGALRHDAESFGRLKGDSRAKDQEIARLTREKQEAERSAADARAEFEILSASTLTGIDVAKELEAVCAELDARKSLIDSLRGDADRAKALESQLDEKRNVISKLEISIDRHVSSIAELQQTVALWKSKYAALKSTDTAADSTIVAALSEASEAELHSLECIEDISGDLMDTTNSVDMRETLMRSQLATGSKITTNR